MAFMRVICIIVHRNSIRKSPLGPSTENPFRIVYLLVILNTWWMAHKLYLMSLNLSLESVPFPFYLITTLGNTTYLNVARSQSLDCWSWHPSWPSLTDLYWLAWSHLKYVWNAIYSRQSVSIKDRRRWGETATSLRHSPFTMAKYLHLSVWNDVLGLLDELNVEPSFNSRTSLPKFNLWSIVTVGYLATFFLPHGCDFVISCWMWRFEYTTTQMQMALWLPALVSHFP